MILLVCIAVAVFALVGALFLAWKKLWTEEFRTALVTMSATFLGVALAVLAAREEADSRTRTEICRLLNVSIGEISAHEALITGADLASSSDGDDKRQILQDPATGLRILLATPGFLEAVELPTGAELLSISTQLSWRTSPQSSSGWPPPPLRMPREASVRANLQRAARLLAPERVALGCDAPGT